MNTPGEKLRAEKVRREVEHFLTLQGEDIGIISCALPFVLQDLLFIIIRTKELPFQKKETLLKLVNGNILEIVKVEISK